MGEAEDDAVADLAKAPAVDGGIGVGGVLNGRSGSVVGGGHGVPHFYLKSAGVLGLRTSQRGFEIQYLSVLRRLPLGRRGRADQAWLGVWYHGVRGMSRGGEGEK